MFVGVSENLSPRVSQDELDVGEQQQPASSRDDDDDDDDDAGSVDQPQHQTEVRRDENAHHHPGRRHRGDRLPAAESNTRCRDVAIQVDDVTRQSSSSQASCHCYHSAFLFLGKSGSQSISHRQLVSGN